MAIAFGNIYAFFTVVRPQIEAKHQQHAARHILAQIVLRRPADDEKATFRPSAPAPRSIHRTPAEASSSRKFSCTQQANRRLGTAISTTSSCAASGDIGSIYARLVTTRCTALVSFGVLKDHDLAGVSGGMKNWYGVIHNPNKYHDDNCDPFVADVVRHPHIRDKLRLTILDAGNAQYDGGPAARPSATWPLGLLAASRDPVAIEAWGWRTIDRERARRKLPSLEAAGRPPRWIGSAARYGLGEGDPGRITEVKAWVGRT